MGFLGKFMGGGSYEPGGEHYVKITDSVFERARGELSSSDSPYAEPFKDFAAEQVSQFELKKYEAHDLPVTKIIAEFCLAHYFQEEHNGIIPSRRLDSIEVGRKDVQDYQAWVEKWKDKLPSSEKGFVGIMSKIDKNIKNDAAGLGLALTTLAAKGIQLGVARIVTGKSKDIRLLEKHYANYICGDSQKAKEYIIGFAEKFGAMDEGVLSVLQTIQAVFWLHEIAKANLAKH